MRLNGTLTPREHLAENVLAARGVSVSFQGVAALRGIDLTLGAGEILGLIGPNGAGKTTLLNVLTGFARPQEGVVRLGHRDVTRLPPHRLARLGVARTFQAVRAFPRLTVRENVEVSAIAVGVRRDEAKTRATEMLAEFGLADRAAAPAASLPYGDERRMALARALVARPRFLLLDEPAAGLNESETDALTQTLASIPDRFGCGVLVVEHDMRLIMSLCQRVHVLAHGATIAEGSPEKIRHNDEVIESYLGRQRVHHHA